MEPQGETRSEQFLKLYRMLEGLLDKRYSGKRGASGSVVMEYLHDDDSAPCRADLDMCREIRNLLSHNVGEGGEHVIEPSEGVLDILRDIVDYVQRPRLAKDFGTPGDRIVFAHPNDCALDIMRHMARMGYSHVPVRDKTGLVGVFSPDSLMQYLCRKGFEGVEDTLHIGDLKDTLKITEDRADRYLFFDQDATLTAVREAFDKRRERNHRVAVAFVTEDGSQQSQVLAMLTPWDLLKDAQ